MRLVGTVEGCHKGTAEKQETESMYCGKNVLQKWTVLCFRMERMITCRLTFDQCHALISNRLVTKSNPRLNHKTI